MSKIERRTYPDNPGTHDGGAFLNDAEDRVKNALWRAEKTLASVRATLGDGPIAWCLQDIATELRAAADDIRDGSSLWSGLGLRMAQQGAANVLRACLAGAELERRNADKASPDASEIERRGAFDAWIGGDKP